MDLSNSDEVEDPCAVCRRNKHMVITVPECSHSFCFECIKGVSVQADNVFVPKSCPICRSHFGGEFLTNHEVQISKFAIGDSAGAVDDEEALEEKPDVEALKAQMRANNWNGVIAPNNPSTSAPRRPVEQPMYWLYGGKDAWWKYQETDRVVLEEKFRAGVDSFHHYIMGTKYTIDFGQMVQFQTENENKMRAIKRCDRETLRGTPVKGTAGALIPVVWTEE